MESKNMAAVESTGKSSELQEQYEKHEKFVGGCFFLPLHLQKPKGGSAERGERKQ